MPPRGVWLALLLCICATLAGASQEIPRRVVETGKRATAMVETKEATGTAFCIDAAGDFITNQHVVGNNARVALILNAGEADQQTIGARVVEADANADLALLTADRPGNFTTLPLAASNAGLVETAQVAAFGFPYGKDLAVAGAQYPSISVSTGRVTALRKLRGALMEIQIDAAVTSGSSGGPVLDAQGRVIGIIVSGFKDAAIHFAIPVEHLQAMLRRPHATIVSPPIPRSRLTAPNVVRFRVAPLNRGHVNYGVSLTRFPHTDRAQTLQATPMGNDTYAATVVPLPRDGPPAFLKLTITGPAGSFTAMAGDTELRIGARKLRLRELVWITGGAPPSVRLHGGAVLVGPVEGLRDLPIEIQGVHAKLNLNVGQTAQVEEIPIPAPTFAYELNVRQPDGALIKLPGSLAIEEFGWAPPYEKAPYAPAEPQPGGQTGGSLSFADPVVLKVPGMAAFSGLRVLDLDHDGHLDILVVAGTDLVVLYGHGDGRTFDTVRYPMGSAGSQIAVADLNHDGHTDGAIAGGRGVQILLNTGVRQFAAPRSYPTGEGACALAIGDFNGDGSPDLAVTNMGSSNFAVLLNRGDGTFGPPALFHTPQYPVSIAAGNLYRENRIDLMVNCFYQADTLRFENDGSGRFEQNGVVTGTGGGQLVIADVTGDGHPDLVGVNYWSGGLAIKPGIDTRVFTLQKLGTKRFPSQIDIADLDGDGALDVIFGNQGTNLFTVCLNLKNGSFGEGITFTVPDGDVHSAVVGDMNEDGNPDVVADGGGDRLFILLDRAPPIPIERRRRPLH